MILNDLLFSLGMTKRSVGADMTDLRMNIIIFTVGLAIFWGLKKILPSSVLNVKKEAKKSPALYVSQIFHAFLIGSLLVLKLFILGYVLNYVLHFFMNEGEDTIHFVEFIVTFVSLVVPTVLLGLICYPAVIKNKRFLPEVKTEAGSIFSTFVIFASFNVTLVYIGLLIHGLLAILINMPDVLGKGLTLDSGRMLLVGLIVACATLMIFVKKSWCRESFLKNG